MVRHSTCPICHSLSIEALFECRDYLVSGESYPVFSCNDCGFRFTQDYPGEDEIGKYYESEDYISHTSSGRNPAELIYKAARNYMLRRKVKLVESACGLKEGSLLDIGSGTGHFAHEMQKAGWHVSTAEINEKARRYSEETFGIKVLHPDDISTLNDNSFDCITLWHVLEHFHDPRAWFLNIRRLLKDNGTCIIALPNNGSYDAHHYGSCWAAWDVPRHLWHFNPQSFAKLAGEEGFGIIRTGRLPLDVFYISYLSEKNKGTVLALPAGLLRAIPWALRTLHEKEKDSSLIYFLKPLRS